jgi:hypothetical protein
MGTQDPSLAQVIETQLADPATGWSVGTWGAVADLERAPGEAGDRAGLAMWTARGAVRVDTTDGLRVLAYERCLRAPGSWRQALALCLRATRAGMHGRSLITPLGPDEAAIRPEDRAGSLFDLGVGARCADFCVRTDDPELVAALQASTGTSIWDPSTGLHRLLSARSPARVVLTRAVRAEVTTLIPPPTGATPPGPHTHLLPKLLATGRTHPAIEPIPAGSVPVATIFPAHPLLDPGAVAIPFDAERHARFQALLRRHGDPAHVETKDTVAAAVQAGEAPGRPTPGPDGVARSRATRVALRQLAQTAPTAPGLDAWRRQFGEPV